MKIKTFSLIFLAGIIIGLSLAPLVKTTPQQALLHPIYPSMAQTKELTLPADPNQILGRFTPSPNQPVKNQPKVLAATIASSQPTSKFAKLIKPDSQKPVQTAPSPQPTKKPSASNPYSGSISVAVFGDSMVDLMGDKLPFLQTALARYYPQAKLKLFNYGMGAQTIETGLARLEKAYQYKGRDYPPLPELNPEIIIIDPFCYNPLGQKDSLYQHWANLYAIVELLKQKTDSQIIILATIAPNQAKFGQGAKDVPLSRDRAWEQAKTISQYLQNSLDFAKANKLPLVDAFTPSLNPDRQGRLEYISPKDHIHQSQAGNQLIANLLAEKIFQLKLF